MVSLTWAWSFLFTVFCGFCLLGRLHSQRRLSFKTSRFFIIYTTTKKPEVIFLLQTLRWTQNRSIRNHIILWFNLRQLCLRLGSTLSWTYCFATSTCFGFAIPVLYVGAIHAQQGNYSTLAGPFNCLLFISILAEMAHQAVEKVILLLFPSSFFYRTSEKRF